MNVWIAAAGIGLTAINLVILLSNVRFTRRVHRAKQISDLEERLTKIIDDLRAQVATLGRELSELKGRLEASNRQQW